MARKQMLVTGASAGIGATFARAYAARGFDLVLTARRAERLETLAAELKTAHGAASLVLPADLADPAAPAKLIAAIEATGRPLDGVVNNAGYGLPGSFANTSWTDQAAFIQVMVTAVAQLTHAVVPGMMERGYGRIINVASLAGILPGSSGHNLYAAAKAFVIKMSQSVNLECTGKGVHVTALCPGLTYSEFHDVNGTRAQLKTLPRWMIWQEAEAVVDAAIVANEANEAVIVTGGPNKAIAALTRLAPESLMMNLMRSQSSRFRRLE